MRGPFGAERGWAGTVLSNRLRVGTPRTTSDLLDPALADDIHANFRVRKPQAFYTSTMPSISTGIPPGSALVPSADRTPMPFSWPKTSTKSSLHPFITAG